MKYIILLIFSAALYDTFPGTGYAQENNEPLYRQFREHFKKEYFTVEMLLQTVGDFQIERSFSGNSGFNIANARLRLFGNLDRGFGYFLQTNFTQSRAILDARLSWRRSRALGFDAGLFKAPFSKELLTYAGSIDFVNRAQVVSALAPGRQIGAQVGGRFADNMVNYNAGIFNGNGFDGNNNDDNNFMFAGRIAVTPPLAPTKETGPDLEFGVNAAFSRDENVFIAGRGFTGDRTLFGMDFRFEYQQYLVAAEYIYAALERSDLKQTPAGFHITGGYMVKTGHQLLARLDIFRPDGFTANSDLIIFGYNWWPTQATELQVNYIIDTDDSEFKHHQLLINAQVAL